VEVVVPPAEDKLQGGVQVGDRAVASDWEAAPDEGADAAQDHAELQGDGTGQRGFRHPAILLFITSPTLASHGLFRSPAVEVQILPVADPREQVEAEQVRQGVDGEALALRVGVHPLRLGVGLVPQQARETLDPSQDEAPRNRGVLLPNALPTLLGTAPS
jgi:hypothetical protein